MGWQDDPLNLGEGRGTRKNCWWAGCGDGNRWAHFVPVTSQPTDNLGETLVFFRLYGKNFTESTKRDGGVKWGSGFGKEVGTCMLSIRGR